MNARAGSLWHKTAGVATARNIPRHRGGSVDHSGNDTHHIIIIPSSAGQTIEQLSNRLKPLASEKEAANEMRTVVGNSFLNYRTKLYDQIQYHQNQIPY